MTGEVALCWVCGERPADSAEHRFKASDLRGLAPDLSQQRPVFLQRDGSATNIRVGGAKSGSIQFRKSICAHCNNTGTQPYDDAWRALSAYLRQNWPKILRERRVSLLKVFPTATGPATLRCYLFFIKLFGCKIVEDRVPINLAEFSAALQQRKPHAEVSLSLVDCSHLDGALMFDSDVHTMTDQPSGVLHGATWLYVAHPFGIKVSYIKAGAPLYVPGSPWCPPAIIMRLSPFLGGTEPRAGPGALLP